MGPPPSPAASATASTDTFQQSQQTHQGHTKQQQQQQQQQQQVHFQERLEIGDPSVFAPAAAAPLQHGRMISNAEVQTQPPPTKQLEERLASLELERLRGSIDEERRRYVAERDEAAAKQTAAFEEELRLERDATRAVSEELAAAKLEVDARSEELSAALAALAEARQQLDTRAEEASHFRAEAARAVGQLEALTDHAERQASQIQQLEVEVAGQRKALVAMRDAAEMQHHALTASEGARAEQAATVTSLKAYRSSRPGSATRPGSAGNQASIPEGSVHGTRTGILAPPSTPQMEPGGVRSPLRR